MHVTPIPAFRDNYIWALRVDDDATDVAVVDPGDAGPVIETLKAREWRLKAILITHHHADHVGGVLDLLALGDVPVYGPAQLADKGVSTVVEAGNSLQLAAPALSFSVGAIPGHTLDHIYYHGHGALFCGDTLFSAGCGRLFEGQPEQMLTSLKSLCQYPDDTRVYCAHEYTLANLKFADAVEPANPAIDDYTEYAHRLRRQGLPTIPSFLALEKKVNPFLRCDVPAVRDAASRAAGQTLNDDVAVFTALRRWKDSF